MAVFAHRTGRAGPGEEVRFPICRSISCSVTLSPSLVHVASCWCRQVVNLERRISGLGPSTFADSYGHVEHAGSEMRAFLAVLEGCAGPDTLLRFAALVSSPDGYWRAWAPYNSDSSPVPRAFRAGFGFGAVGWEETPGSRGDGVLEAGPRHWMGGRMGISWMEAGPSLACREPSHRAQNLEWGGCDKQQMCPRQQASGW